MNADHEPARKPIAALLRSAQGIRELILTQAGIFSPSGKLLVLLVFSNIILLPIYFVFVAIPLIGLSVMFEWNLGNQSIYDTYVFGFRPIFRAFASCYCLWHYRSSFSSIGKSLAQGIHRYRMVLAIVVAGVSLLPRLHHLDALCQWIQETGTGINGVEPSLATIIELLPHGDWKKLLLSISTYQLIIYTIFICSISPIYEEIVYSGLLCNYLTKKTGLIGGLLVTPLFFAVSHTYWYDISTDLFYLWFGGLIYVLLRALTGSIWLGLAAHVFHNMILYGGVWALKLSFQ